ncbi:MAG: deoxyribodipyrimidine photo-lyase, partial [Saprospiraceae bacterium]
MRRVLLWFRQDLRLHDNEALQDALRIADEVIPVYIFDTRIWQGHTKTGFPKIGPHRARFVLESVAALRDSLRSIGSDLIVRIGISEDEIFDIARQVRSSNVFCNRDRTQEEVDVQDALEQKLWTIGQELKYSRGRMLYYTADLPFPVNQTPDTFNAFRKEVEKIVQIRPPLPVTATKPTWSCDIEPGELPTLSAFGIASIGNSGQSCVGGEAEGLNRAKNLIWNSSSAGTLKTAVEDQFTADLNSICSPWLSSGSLSPKKLYEELRTFEEENGANELTHNLFTDLLLRDFHRFIGKKY